MKILSIIAAAFIMLSAPAFAHDGTPHYVGQKVADSKQAVKSLNSHIAQAQVIFRKSKLADQDLEKIHEISYSLETASDKLAEEHPKNSTIDAVAEAVQALHYSSEKHKEKETRQWFSALQKANKDLKL